MYHLYLIEVLMLMHASCCGQCYDEQSSCSHIAMHESCNHEGMLPSKLKRNTAENDEDSVRV